MVGGMSFGGGRSQPVGSRYVQLLDPSALNNGTVAGGAAYALTAALQGFMHNRDNRKRAAAQSAMLGGVSAKPWVDPGALNEMGEVEGAGKTVGTAGGYEGGVEALSKLSGNPYARDLAGDLLGRQALAGPQKRQIETDAGGFKRFVDDGARVFPDAAAAPEGFEPVPPAMVARLNLDPTKVYQVDLKTERVYAVGDAAPTGQMPPFSGNGIVAQDRNTLIALGPKIQDGTATPQEQQAYALAYRSITEPRVMGSPESGFYAAQRPPLPQSFPSPGRLASALLEPSPAAATPASVSPEAPTAPDLNAEAGATVSMGESPAPITQLTEPRASYSDSQGKAATFSDRMYASNAILEQHDKEGTNFWSDLKQRNVPYSEFVQSNEYQLYEQAKRDFINAVLRRESGAAISPEEFENGNKQYFPVPGNTPDVIERKRQSRLLALQGMQREAGPFYVIPNKERSVEGVTGSVTGSVSGADYRLGADGNVTRLK